MRRPRVSATILRHLVSFRDRLWLAACIICLSGFVAVCFTALIAARWETDRRADFLAVTTAATAADAIGRMIDQADVAIRGTIEHLAIAQAAAPDEPLHSTVLFGHASSGGLLEFIDVMNEDSYVTEALQPSERGIRWLGRDYFIAQKNNASLGLFISRPFGRDQAIGVALSRRLSHPDGTFAGVVVAGLRLIQVRDLLAGSRWDRTVRSSCCAMTASCSCACRSIRTLSGASECQGRRTVPFAMRRCTSSAICHYSSLSRWQMQTYPAACSVG